MIDAWDTLNTRCRAVFWTAVIAPIFSTIFVALRFWCRAGLTNTLGADDWASLITLLLAIAFSVVLAISTHYGSMGLHIWQMTPELEAAWFKWLTIQSEPYVASITGYKVALILLYLRVFKINARFKWACYMAMAFILGYGICNMLTQVLGCHPLHKFWNKEAPGHCINYLAANQAFGAMFVISDLVVAILPIPMVWTLQMRKQVKWQLTLVFLSGATAFLVSITKFVLGVVDQHSYDRFGIAALDYVWAPLEVNTGIICGCTPTLKPMLNLVREYSAIRSSTKTTSATVDTFKDKHPLKLEQTRSKSDSDLEATLPSLRLGNVRWSREIV